MRAKFLPRSATDCGLLLFAAAVVLAGAPAAECADRVVISTGNEGGSYHYIGKRLKTELILRNEPLPVVRTSQGSLDNLARIDDPTSDVNVGLTQADALRSYLVENPDFSSRFFLLGDMGKECAFVITSQQGGIVSLADLKREGAGDFSVDSRVSGAAVTFSTLRALDPAYQAANPVFLPVMEALLQLKLGGEFAQLRGAMLVQRPRRISPPLRAVLDAPETYRFVPITADDVPNATLPDGSPVYSYETVTVGKKERVGRPELETICTRALLLGSRDKLDHELRARLAALMLEAGERIAGSDE